MLSSVSFKEFIFMTFKTLEFFIANLPSIILTIIITKFYKPLILNQKKGNYVIKENWYGDWGLGIGDWGLGPIPNPQSPIPKSQSPIPNLPSPHHQPQHTKPHSKYYN